MIYSPREDSFLLEKYVKKYSKGKSVLDVGSGSGIQAEAAIKAEACSVLAIDIDSEVISHLSKKHIKALQSDLFSNVKGKFDLIVFNPPYLPSDKNENDESARTNAGGKRGDEIIIRFLKSAKKYLNSNGKIILLLSSLTPQNKIKILLKKLNLNHKILETKSFFFERLEVWEIR